MAGRDLAEEHLAALEYEINADRAATLGRYGRRVEVAIARCHDLLDGLDRGDAVAVAAYGAARRAALEAVEAFCVQREALRLYDHYRVHQIFRVPPPIGR